MDGYSGKRAARGPKKGCGIALKDTAKNMDENAQLCTRLGYNGRVKYTQNTKSGSSVGAKCPRPSVHSSNDKRTTRYSSRMCPTVTNTKMSASDSKRKFSSQLEIDKSENRVSDEPRDHMPSPSRTRKALRSESRHAKTHNDMEIDMGSSTVTSNTKPGRVSNHNPGSCCVNNQLDPASLLPKSSGLSSRSCGSRSRYNLRSLKCNSASDAIPRSCPTLDSKPSAKRVVKRRNPVGESSSSRGVNQTTAVSSIDRHVRSTSGTSISNSRHNRSCAAREDGSGVASVCTRRSTNKSTLKTRSTQHNANGSSVRELAVTVSQLPRPEIPVDADGFNSSQHYSSGVSSIGSRSDGVSSGNGNNLSAVMPAELGITHLVDHNRLQRPNMAGVAEVLLALQRIEQDQQLTHEQIMALENSLILNGLGRCHDQHRYMRLDIDNMSYEELLALEERMGTVSTALSEEELSKCLMKVSYQSVPPGIWAGSFGDDNDIKCCICQAEYVDGDEIGKLKCQHGHHVACIEQWLRLKNWCPICKVSASSSQSVLA